jgi:hypothetical protein
MFNYYPLQTITLLPIIHKMKSEVAFSRLYLSMISGYTSGGGSVPDREQVEKIIEIEIIKNLGNV